MQRRNADARRRAPGRSRAKHAKLLRRSAGTALECAPDMLFTLLHLLRALAQRPLRERHPAPLAEDGSCLLLSSH